MQISDFKSSFIKTIIQKFANNLEKYDKIDDLVELYPNEIDAYLNAIGFALKTEAPDFRASLILAQDDKYLSRIVDSASVVFALEDLLDNPSQEDFYGTEGWEHFLGID